ncbi:hypothetical protein BGW80DRAFT_1248944 [Lactifluus volemus]|nr:hypothetical protein BGW80DRAFT_1248944 [Lactifluus volemus]
MSASDERIRLLKEELQHARAERDRQRALHKAENDAEKESRDKAARERHEGTMNQLRAMRELLFEQRESQAQEKGRMEERHAEEVRLHETTLKQMSDVRTAVGSLRDESRADWEQRAEEQARIKADSETAVKKLSESVAETREQLLSLTHELQEDTTRRHEEVRHILLANASARESVSMGESV